MRTHEQQGQQSRSGSRKLALRAGAAALTVAALTAPAVPADAHNLARPHCIETVLPVSLQPGQPKDKQIDVTYCRANPKQRITSHTPIAIGYPGAGYTKSYFDGPGGHSYKDATLRRGIDVLTITPLGRVEGKSSLPVSTQLSLATGANTIHQAIDKAYDWGYRNVAVVAHSVGSEEALHEAAEDKRVRNLVLTGLLPQYTRNPAVAANNVPANQDPKFKYMHPPLDSEYLTGINRDPFYAKPNTTVKAWDTAHKDVISLNVFKGYAIEQAAAPNTSPAKDVGSRVMVLYGENDSIYFYPGKPASTPSPTDIPAIRAHTEQFFTNAKSLDIAVAHGLGHSVFLDGTVCDFDHVADTVNDFVLAH